MASVISQYTLCERKKTMFAEIRNNYETGPLFDGSSIDAEGYLGYISIDGWRTLDENEEGQVIAAVMLTPHGDIVVDWHDNGARLNENALTAITEAKVRLQSAYQDWQTEHRADHSLRDFTQETQSLYVDNGAGSVKAGTETRILVIRLDYATEPDDDGYLVYRIHQALDKSMDEAMELAKKAAADGREKWSKYRCGGKAPAFLTGPCDDTVDVFIEHSFKEAGIGFELCDYDLQTMKV